MFTKSIAYIVEEVYRVIEENKKPYLFTKQKEDELDSTGYFLSCPRLEGESDENYFYRLSNWTQRNAACNIVAIEDVCKELKYSAATYVPHTMGVGTATVYVIPEGYDEDDKEIALNEAKEKLSKVISPSSIVSYEIPKERLIKLVAYLDVSEAAYDKKDHKDSDLVSIKNDVTEKIKKYINSIAPGNRLMLGEINRLGLSYKNVEYFNVIQMYVNGDETSEFELMQEIKSKFIFDEIVWWEVNS